MKNLTVPFAIIAISLSSSLHAGNVNERQAAQRNSIQNGYEDGSLTGAEARRLGKQQLKTERKEQYFRADGEVTPRERANMNATLDANRGRIYRQRHDNQTQD